MWNGNEFGSEKWRSPLTGRTSEEILEQRETFNRNVRAVNKQVRADREAKAARLLELEEKEND
jgi:hypothetical protein